MKSLLALLVLVTANVAAAQSVTLGSPATAGTGCPAGTVSATLSPDNTSLTILFDQYVAQAGRNYGKQLDRKGCDVAIPVNIPQGYSVSLLNMDYRGFIAIPSGGRAMLSVEYFFAGSRGPRVTRQVSGPMADNYTFGDLIQASALVWSPCGTQVILRANTGMAVFSNARGDDAIATVDSIDAKAKLVYHLQWRRCI